MSLEHTPRVLAATLLALAIAATVAASVSAEEKPDTRDLQPKSVAIDAKPIARFSRIGGAATRFGKLEFRGGLVLTAPEEKYFGGWSGLIVDPDARSFAAVSDSGTWLTGDIAYRDGAPASITDARLGPLLALDGKILRRNRDRDAEAIALESGTLDNGRVIVSYEQNSRLVRYDLMRDGMSSGKGLLQKPKATAKMRRNGGFEAMTVMRGGTFSGRTVAMAERLYDKARNHTGWIWTPAGEKIFHLVNIGVFDVTDIASLDDGTLFVLERRFRWLEGVKMRIRRIAAQDLQPDKTIDGEILIEADMEYEIDNMEGLALSRAPTGETILTLISDDNFNRFLQRTLLLQFALPSLKTAKTRPQQ